MNIQTILNTQTVLLITHVKHIDKTITQIIKKAKVPIILVSASKGYTTMKQTLQKAKVNTKNIIFIDTISQPQKTNEDDTVIFVKNPTDLTGLSIAITTTIDAIPNKKIMILNSLDTLAIYNPQEIVLRFLHSILQKTTSKNTNMITLTIKETNPTLSTRAAQFFEKTITN